MIVGLLLCLVIQGEATFLTCSLDPSCQVLVDGTLVNPRKVNVVKCATVYVAEAGTGNNDGAVTQAAFPFCIGYTENMSVSTGRTVSGLPSSRHGVNLAGPIAIGSSGQNTYVLIGDGANLPSPFASIQQFVGSGVPTGGTVPYANVLITPQAAPVAMSFASQNTVVVADAAAMALYTFVHGTYVSSQSVAPIVPTSVAFLGSTLYFSSLTTVYVASTNATYSDGFTDIVDIGFDVHGRLFVLENFGRLSVVAVGGGAGTEIVGPSSNSNWLVQPFGLYVHNPAFGGNSLTKIFISDGRNTTSSGSLFAYQPGN